MVVFLLTVFLCIIILIAIWLALKKSGIDQQWAVILMLVLIVIVITGFVYYQPWPQPVHRFP